LPWSWATERLTKAHTYWIATTRPDGRPHVMPVWGVWLDNQVYFSTGAQSRKARNLAANPHCVVSIELAGEAMSVEGVAKRVDDPAMVQRFAEVYGPKYEWDMTGFAEPLYAVRPMVAFGFIAGTGEFTSTATRWVFEKG
jgi:PPOX class probable F420-dependent enzyme